MPYQDPDSSRLQFHATCALGAEQLLAAELREAGASAIRAGAASVGFRGGLETAYRVCLWSRVGGRVLLQLGECPAADGDGLYRATVQWPWEQHLGADNTLSINATMREAAIRHSHYAALKLKDAVVDRIRTVQGRRPSIDTRQPDLRLHLHLQRQKAVVSVDLAGSGLHQRGYRDDGARAPLKETLAAALLLFAGWPALARAGKPFVDPMCGSGTLLIEAAMIAGDLAPGLLRPYFGFQGWLGHDAGLWQTLLTEARERAAAGRTQMPPILGMDQDEKALAATRANLVRAGLEQAVRLRRQSLAQLDQAPADTGLLLTNPPYGHRLQADEGNPQLYRTLGRKLTQHYAGWQVGVFSAEPDLLHRMRLRAEREIALYNGPIACRLALYRVPATRATDSGETSTDTPAPGQAPRPAPVAPVAAEGAEMFANRLRKNLRHWSRWARRQGLDCYRVYDQDLPEFALAVDVYNTADDQHLLVQEYRAPAKVDPALAQQRVQAALTALAEVFEVDDGRVHLKTRERQKGLSQYEKLDRQGRYLTVGEGGHRFLVNLTDYLDSGLFLDHRITRSRLQAEATGRDFLNLFAYTGSASVYAAAGGALSTTSVDLSANYLDWCRRNLALNGFEGVAHVQIQADCREWLEQQQGLARRYGLIFLDPPTFSNSKRMDGTFDVQRDHVELLELALALLSAEGSLYFSTNARRFRLDPGLAERWSIQDLSRETLPEDFRRNPRIHQCWRLQRRESL